MIYRYQLYLTILIVFSCLSCGLLNRSYPVTDFYTLNVGNIEEKGGEGSDDLKIMRVRLNSKYYVQDFNYKVEKNKFTSDFYNKFYKPVDSIISAELYKSLSGTNIFRDVVPQNSVLKTRYFLYTNIIDIYGDFTNDSSKAVLNIEFFLTDESGDIPELIFNSVYNR